MLSGINQAEEVLAVLLTHKSTVILKVKRLLIDYFMFVFENVKPYRLLFLNISSDRIHSIYIFIGVAIKYDLLRIGNSKPEILAFFSIKLKQVLVVLNHLMSIFFLLF